MEKEYFLNDEISLPQPLEFENTLPIAWNGVNCNAEQSFLDHSNSSSDRYSHLESAIRSMVSSPAPSNSGLSRDGLALHELIGKLGGIGVFPPASSTATAEIPYSGTNNNGTNDSCPTTLNSPLKLNLSILDHINIPNSVPLTPLLPVVSADPEFPAKFSSSGSRSLNSRITPFGGNNADVSQHKFNTPLMENRKLSSPCLKKIGSLVETMNLSQEQIEMRPANEVISGSDKDMNKFREPCANSNEESSVSEKIPGGEKVSITFNDLNSRKRKAVYRGKSKEDASTIAKVLEGNGDANIKRSKPTESGRHKNVCAKTEMEPEGSFGNENDKQKANQKPPEPPKDYIHVRARRGQATDSHSLAERVRREKISERMKLLQDLVPGCNKVTGKALMLDEIINYVQSLQCQVEFLSMKLSSVNPGLDFNINNLLAKDMFQQNATQPQQMLYPLDSSAPAFYNHQPHQNVQQQMDPLPSVHRFAESLPQFPAFGEDDLNSIVQMSYGQNPVEEPFHPHHKFPVPNTKVGR